MRSQRQLGRWLAREIWGRELPRRPPRRRRGPPRNYKYRAWIRTLPCSVCGTEPAGEAAHTGNDGGMRQKASDYSCIPLCADCHRFAAYAYHSIGRQSFEQRFNLDIAELVRRLNRCWFNHWKVSGGQYE